MNGTVKCCPAPKCSSSNIYPRTRNPVSDLGENDDRYRCQACGNTFDTPDERERTSHGDIPVGTLASRLADPNVREVSDL